MRTSRARWGAAGMLAGLMAVPVIAGADTGDNLREGVRNGTASRETEIIGQFDATGAAKGGYVTRQSNTQTGPDAGGGAIYGCRGAAGGTASGSAPCLRATNLADGYAFEFNTDGLVGGLFTAGGDPGTPNEQARPFTTNALAVATGLNADRVDGRHGEDLLGKDEKAVAAGQADNATQAANAASADDADALQGKQARDITMWAVVEGDTPPTLVRDYGATDVIRINAGNYRVEFERDVDECAAVATGFDVNENLIAAAGPDATNAARIFVSLRDTADVRTDGDFNLAVHC